MLAEMTSPVFREKRKPRPPVCFKKGLNVVLGKEDGENSIGKSSALLAIDFVFGGDSYLYSDGVKHIGAHTIFFAFEFDGKRYHFARNTSDAENVQVCDRNYNLTGTVWEKHRFCDWLREKYHIDFAGLSFRESVSSFFRIYGKDNLDERRPLKGLPGESMQKSIDVLVKLFDRYKDIEDFSARLEEQKKKLSAFREARRYRFVPDLVGGKTQYEENLTQIRSLETELDNLVTETTEIHDSEDIEKVRLKSQLDGERLRLETDIQTKQRRLALLDMSLESGLYPTEADLSALQEYFPQVNVRKLYEVERYHRKLAKILDDQFSVEKEQVQGEIAALQEQLQTVRSRIRELGFVGNVSREFLDRHSELKGRIDALKLQNEAYLTLLDLQDVRKNADDTLKSAITGILADIEQGINAKMKEFNASLYTDARKAPRLHFNNYNSYTFETLDDTGTGTNYKGMVLYDLAVLYLTALPAIAHDSLIQKNISDGAIDGIMKIYTGTEKQVFIAFDKQGSYREGTRRILLNNTVLKLSDDNSELYGESWNKEESQ